MRGVNTEDATAMQNEYWFNRQMKDEAMDAAAEEQAYLDTLTFEREEHFGTVVMQDLEVWEEECNGGQWPAFRSGFNVILQLYEDSLPKDEFADDANPILKTRDAAYFGVRPTSEYLYRRRGSGVFTDLIAGALTE